MGDRLSFYYRYEFTIEYNPTAVFISSVTNSNIVELTRETTLNIVSVFLQI